MYKYECTTQFKLVCRGLERHEATITTVALTLRSCHHSLWSSPDGFSSHISDNVYKSLTFNTQASAGGR